MAVPLFCQTIKQLHNGNGQSCSGRGQLKSPQPSQQQSSASLGRDTEPQAQGKLDAQTILTPSVCFSDEFPLSPIIAFVLEIQTEKIYTTRKK